MKKATKIIFLAISLAMTSTVFSLPRLSLADREFDFGRVEPLSKQTMVIELSNDGDSRLEIYRVRVCCGATASISTNSIPPNGSMTLTVTLGPMAKPGPFHKKVTLTTNDPAVPVVEIPIVGKVSEATIETQGDEAVISTLPDPVKLPEVNVISQAKVDAEAIFDKVDQRGNELVEVIKFNSDNHNVILKFRMWLTVQAIAMLLLTAVVVWLSVKQQKSMPTKVVSAVHGWTSEDYTMVPSVKEFNALQAEIRELRREIDFTGEGA